MELSLADRIRRSPPGINPKLVFKLRLNPKANLDDDQIPQLGLHVLSRDAARVVVVFPDQASLEELRSRLRQYSGIQVGNRYAALAAIDAIEEFSPADRTGRRLTENPISVGERALLDVELWHTGDIEDCRSRVGQVRDYLAQRNLRVTDSYVGTTLCLVRAELDLPTLAQLLTVDYVKEIERRPIPSFHLADLSLIELGELAVAGAPAAGATGVVVIDSGVAQAHPLIAPALADAQVFPDRMRQRIQGAAEDGDTVSGGHGTAVAGIAIYGDVGESVTNRAFVPEVWLFSARVTDDQNEYDPEELVEHQLREAVEYFLNNYPNARVFNISLGDEKHVYRLGDYQYRLAAAVDELAYEYRDRNIVFVISAGNYVPDDLSAEEMMQQYPGYLLDRMEGRVIDPGTSAIAVTVGGLSYGEAHDPRAWNYAGVERALAGTKSWPSPFSRTGWGVDGAIKPDVADAAGDVRLERGRILYNNPTYAGVPTTAKSFSPPNGRLFRSVAGTSYASPRVAHCVARLIETFPNASANLIRALLAAGCRVPDDRPPTLSGIATSDDRILRLYGYGQPDFLRSRYSATNDVLLLSDSTIAIDSFRLYEIPPLPAEFLEVPGRRQLSVCLAFDPPTRHTRGDSYLGISMEFALYRNVDAPAVADAIRAWSQEEREDLEDRPLPRRGQLKGDHNAPPVVKLLPGTNRRKKGTLQRGVAKIARGNWQYDGRPLILAVICQRKWAPPEITEQRYSVVLSVSHEDENVDLHARLRQQARVYQRIRVRA